VLAALETGQTNELAAVLGAKDKVIVSKDGFEKTLRGADQVSAWMADQKGTLRAGAFFCTGNCCLVPSFRKPHDQTLVSIMCFAAGPTPRLKSLGLN